MTRPQIFERPPISIFGSQSAYQVLMYLTVVELLNSLPSNDGQLPAAK